MSSWKAPEESRGFAELVKSYDRRPYWGSDIMGRWHPKPNQCVGGVPASNDGWLYGRRCDNLSAYKVSRNTAPCGEAFPLFVATQVLEAFAGEDFECYVQLPCSDWCSVNGLL
ncbi:hypothetical protein CDAR_109041 [Caerostris darwini]|uniref:Uncharacterized protein n=1 Tax=Caerostris darwini TaxID=1538125 RepID=A0AAV4VEG9_9ARAC|nr:hypothetical protein CDAR_109041 [Caerostris darwini]